MLLALMCVVVFAACGNLAEQKKSHTQYDFYHPGGIKVKNARLIKGTSIILVEELKWRIHDKFTVNLSTIYGKCEMYSIFRSLIE